MKRKRVRATIEDEAIYAEIEGHVDAEAYVVPSPDQPPLLEARTHE